MPSLLTQLKAKTNITVKEGAKVGSSNRIHITAKQSKQYLGFVYQRSKGVSWRYKFDGTNTTSKRYASVDSLVTDIDIFIRTSKTSESKKETTTKKTVSKPKLKTGFIETNNEVSKIDYGIENSKNILLKGDTGCGKSFLIEEMAKKYKKKLYTVSCDVELDKSEIIGKYEVKDGKTVWIDGVLILAMKEGAWIVFDEINMAKPEIISVLHRVLDDRRTITVKEHNNEDIKAEKGFRVFASINPDYAGTTEFNYAFRRRWTEIIEMFYLSAANETKLLMKRKKIDKEQAVKLVRIGHDTRRMYSEGKLSHPISTAHLLEFAEMLNKSNFKPIECAELTLNVSDDFGEMEDILNVVKNYF